MNYRETAHNAAPRHDDMHPWRVIGLGSGWAVVDTRDGVTWRGEDVYEAHARARVANLLHPAGRPDRIDGEPCNISGPLATIPERLAGLAFIVRYKDDEPRAYLAFVFQEPGPGLRVFNYSTNRAEELSVEILAHDARYAIDLDIEPFRKAEKVML